jgi:hypothetical protein
MMDDQHQFGWPNAVPQRLRGSGVAKEIRLGRVRQQGSSNPCCAVPGLFGSPAVSR